jgi:glycosyl-4,4'-diaponeurosporenoate acyltransferase
MSAMVDWRIAVVIDAVVWVALGVGVGGYQARRTPEQLVRTGPFTAMSPREYGGGWYRRVLRVDAWKDRLPDAGTWFGGLSKRSLPATADGGWRRFAAECLRAERTHLAMFAALPFFALWNPPAIFVGNVIYAIVANLPCLIVARFNRARIMKLVVREGGLA